MKKFMFSAVALIAFSFAGMANTGGEEKLNMKNLISDTIENDTNCLECLDAGMEEYDLASSWGATEGQATAIMNIAIAMCQGYTWSQMDQSYIDFATDF
jgi:hypothetical protein